MNQTRIQRPPSAPNSPANPDRNLLCYGLALLILVFVGGRRLADRSNSEAPATRSAPAAAEGLYGAYRPYEDQARKAAALERQDLGRYRIFETRSADFNGARCQNFKILLEGSKPATRPRLEGIAMKILQSPDGRGLDCAWFFFYAPGTDTSGEYTAGRVEWGPDGDPTNARLRPETRGQDMKMTTDISPPTNEAPPPASRRIPEKRRRRIYYREVQIEDQQVAAGHLPDNDVTDRETEKEFRVSSAAADAIGAEGLYKHWPMPPDPSLHSAQFGP